MILFCSVLFSCVFNSRIRILCCEYVVQYITTSIYAYTRTVLLIACSPAICLHQLEKTDKFFRIEFSDVNVANLRRILAVELPLVYQPNLEDAIKYSPPETVYVPLPELAVDLFAYRPVTLDAGSYELHECFVPRRRQQQQRTSRYDSAATLRSEFRRLLPPHTRLTEQLRERMLAGRVRAVEVIGDIQKGFGGFVPIAHEAPALPSPGSGPETDEPQYSGVALRVDRYLYHNRVFNIPQRFPHPAFISLLIYSRYMLVII